jgi:hypothetical protein
MATGMKLLTLTLSLILLSGVVSAEVPQWVQPGITATYRTISGGWDNGRPTENNAAEFYITNQVDEVTAEGTTGTAYIYNPHTGQTQTQQVICLEGGAACLGRFWLDPDDPTGSYRDETGVTYTVLGRDDLLSHGKGLGCRHDGVSESWERCDLYSDLRYSVRPDPGWLP